MKRLTLFLFSSMLFLACNDPCKDVNCGNGTCDEDSGNCICDDWYEGTNCELEMRTKFLGTWNSTSPCTLGSSSSDPTWSMETAANINTFILKSPDVYDNIIIEATLLSENQAQITPFSAGPASFTGTISYINETTMSMKIAVVSPGNNFDCQYSVSR